MANFIIRIECHGRTYEDELKSWRSSLKALCERAPNLAVLGFHASHCPPWIIDDLLSFSHLRSLEISSILPYSGFLTLAAAMPNLAKLHILVNEDGSTPFPLVLTNMHELYLYTFNGASLVTILTHLSLPTLFFGHFSIFDADVLAVDHHACAAAIAGATSPHALRKLSLAFNGTFHTSRVPAADLAAVAPVELTRIVEPLVQVLGALDAFVLRFDGPLKLSADDTAFRLLVNAAPQLRVLRIDFRTWHEAGSVPTAHTLALFARGCPRLVELVLPYLAPMPMGEDNSERKVHQLRKLFVADDSIRPRPSCEEVKEIVDGVEALFPALDLTFRSFILHRGRLWTDVFDQLRDRHGEAVAGA